VFRRVKPRQILLGGAIDPVILAGRAALSGGWAAVLAWPEDCEDNWTSSGRSAGQELNLQPAIASAPVNLRQDTPQPVVFVPSIAGDDVFGQMLRLVQDAGLGIDDVPTAAAPAIAGSRQVEIEPLIRPRLAATSAPPASGPVPAQARKDARPPGARQNAVRGHTMEEALFPNIPAGSVPMPSVNDGTVPAMAPATAPKAVAPVAAETVAIPPPHAEPAATGDAGTLGATSTHGGAASQSLPEEIVPLGAVSPQSAAARPKFELSESLRFAAVTPVDAFAVQTSGRFAQAARSGPASPTSVPTSPAQSATTQMAGEPVIPERPTLVAATSIDPTHTPVAAWGRILQPFPPKGPVSKNLAANSAMPVAAVEPRATVASEAVTRSSAGPTAAVPAPADAAFTMPPRVASASLVSTKIEVETPVRPPSVAASAPAPPGLKPAHPGEDDKAVWTKPDAKPGGTVRQALVPDISGDIEPVARITEGTLSTASPALAPEARSEPIGPTVFSWEGAAPVSAVPAVAPRATPDPVLPAGPIPVRRDGDQATRRPNGIVMPAPAAAALLGAAPTPVADNQATSPPSAIVTSTPAAAAPVAVAPTPAAANQATSPPNVFFTPTPAAAAPVAVAPTPVTANRAMSPPNVSFTPTPAAVAPVDVAQAAVPRGQLIFRPIVATAAETEASAADVPGPTFAASGRTMAARTVVGRPVQDATILVSGLAGAAITAPLSEPVPAADAVAVELPAVPRMRAPEAESPASLVGSAALGIGSNTLPVVPQVAGLGGYPLVQETMDSSAAPQSVQPPPTIVVAKPSSVQAQIAPPVSVSVIQPPANDTIPVSADRRSAPHTITKAMNTSGRDAGEVSAQRAATPDVPPAAPVTTAASAAAPAQKAHVPSAIAQIAPTLVMLARTADGAQQMTVRLHPAELGMVQVRIERATSGLTQIDITADRPETLLALQRDQPSLHRTLDQAGVPSAGRTISFHAVPPAPASSSGGNATSGQNGGQHTPFGRPGYVNSDADASAGGGHGGYFSREDSRWQNARHPAAGPQGNGANAPADRRTYRAGLDIIA
jgi:hypothetical protein